MITLEQELQDSIARDSRAPSFSAVVEESNFDIAEVSGIDDSEYTVREVKYNGFWYACTGHRRAQQETGGKVYFRKMFSVTQASDCNAPWDSSFGRVQPSRALRADRCRMTMEEGTYRIFVVYWYEYIHNLDWEHDYELIWQSRGPKLRYSWNGGGVWTNEIWPGGQSWLEDHIDYDVIDVAWADVNNFFVVLRKITGHETKVVNFHRDRSRVDVGTDIDQYYPSKDWENGKYWIFPNERFPGDGTSMMAGRHAYGFADDSQRRNRQYYSDKALVLNSTNRSNTPTYYYEQTKNRVYRCKYVYNTRSEHKGGIFTMYEEALGGAIEDLDHQFLLVGPMTEINN